MFRRRVRRSRGALLDVLADALARDESRRRGLLGEALRKSLRLGIPVAGYFDGNREFRRVVWPGPRGFAIEWRGKAARLCPFLQRGLWIAQRVSRRVHPFPERGDHDGVGRLIARVEKNRAYDRFANIAQNRHVGGSCLLFDFAKPDAGVNPPGEGDLGAALLADEARKAAREFSLAGLGKRFVQHPGNGETQYAVAEEFEPLIGFALAPRRRANMGQRRRNQIAIGENVPDPRLERSDNLDLPRHTISRI